MRWFRYWSEALSDPKVQLLPGDDFKGWINLLSVVNETEPSRGPRSGYLPASLVDVAYKLHGRAPDALDLTTTLLDRLVAVGLFDEANGRYRAHNWPRRQPVSDDVGKRVNKSRKGVTGNDSETLQKPRKRRTRTAPEGEGEGELERDLETDPEEREGSRDRAPEPQPPRGSEIAKDWAEVQAAYEATIGPLLPADQQRLGAYCRQMPKDWVLAAIAETGGARDPGWPYLDKILRRCVNTSKPPSGSKKAPAAGSARAAILDRYQRKLASAAPR